MSNQNRYHLRKRTGGGNANGDVDPPEEPVIDAASPKKAASSSTDYQSGTNWVHAGGIEANPYLFVLLVASPFLSLLLAYATGGDIINNDWRVTHPLSEMLPACTSDVSACISNTLSAGMSVVPTMEGARFVLIFMTVALVLEKFLPGKIGVGPETATGHVPRYVDNGVAHCFVYSVLFFLGSNLGPCGESNEQLFPALEDVFEKAGVCNVYTPYNFGIFYDVFEYDIVFLEFI